ncbi:MAG: FAD binding domain-containing protein [Treponema sp.]|jgi:CO/xanthine dehydrogenase FAD-binding subunit|nr:FAD binding domain-containing protein [Treponema sp.]
MDTNLNQVFYPANFNDLFSTWNRYPDAVPYAGGTDFLRWQSINIIKLPKVVLCLDKIEELRRITRTEQYLEIGAMVKLNQLFRLGKIVPQILYRCMENIAGVQVRNISTIGGNICASSGLHDLSAVLTALDAQYEIRGANSTTWISAVRFHDKNPLKKQEILTRIRLPLIQWDYSIYKKFPSKDNFLDNLSAEVLVFLARAKKTILTDLRVVYKSGKILRNRNSEDSLMGKNLPLSRKIAFEFVENWKEFLGGRRDVSEFSKNALLKNIEENVFLLSD